MSQHTTPRLEIMPQYQILCISLLTTPGVEWQASAILYICACRRDGS